MKRKPHLTEAQFDKKFEQLRARLNKQVTSTGLLPESVVTIRQSILDDTLLSYQLNWIDDKAQIKIWEKSRRIGASWAEAADAVLYAASRDGANVWYISYNKDMTAGFIDDCVYWVRQYSGLGANVEEILDDKDKDILGYKIRFSSGNTITALSSKASNLRSKGKPGEWLIIDEAAFVDDLSGLLKAAMAFLLWGGSIHIISTHNGETNAFNSLILDTRAGKFDYKIHRTTLSQAVKAGLVKRIFKVIGKAWSKAAENKYVAKIRAAAGLDAEEEFDVVPSQGTGRPFPRALVEPCMCRNIPVLRYHQDDKFLKKEEYLKKSIVGEWLEDNVKPHLDKLDPKRRCYVGEDFARSGHLTVFYPLQEQEDVTFAAPFILELHNLPYEEQKQVAFYIFDNLPRFTHATMDGRGNGHWLAETCFLKYGEERITISMPSEKWYRENMPAYQKAFQERSILIPYDADLLEDHGDFRQINGVAALPKIVDKSDKTKKKKKERHGDTGIAGCNAWHATRQEVHQDFDFESTGEECASSEEIF